MTAAPAKVEVVGTPISTTSYDELLELLGRRPAGGRARTVAFCNVHAVVEARRDPELAAALRAMDVAAPDGMPLVWALRALGRPAQRRVYGPDLMEMALRHGVDRGWRHYFYGSTAATLERLVAAAGRIAPGVQVVGAHSPPFRPLTPDERTADVQAIAASGATHVWVGLGMPKQEKLVQAVAGDLPGTSLLAVGAAFAMHAGDLPQAPDWLQDRGLEWAYRLAQEPGRLWRRYLSTNPAFVVLLAGQLLGARLRRGTAGGAPSTR